MSESKETLWDQTQPESEAQIQEPSAAEQERPAAAPAAAETEIPAESAEPARNAAPAVKAEAAEAAAAPEAQDTAPAENVTAQAAEPVNAEPIENAAPAEEAIPGAEAPKPAREMDSWYRSESEPPIYADAHYEPAGATTTPPRYYTPPDRTERPRKEKSAKKTTRRGLGLGGAVALCLVCAMLGGLLGAGLNGWTQEKRFTAIEEALEENSRLGAENSAAISAVSGQQTVTASPVISTGTSLSPSQIYHLACDQVVGITTSYTSYGYFGNAQTGTISGSGFVLSEDGYIVTNYHVVQTANERNLPVTVVFHDGSEYEASIVGTEDVNDLAVLKIEASGLTPAKFGNSDELQVGDEIYAVGNPLGELEYSMSTGHVSALNRSISTEEAEAISMFQLDAAVNPGNSGGPVYNSRGEVVGVVTAKYSDYDVEGLGFAIPSNDALRIAEDLATMGYVTGKAYLGIWTDERYNAMVAQYYNMPLGAYVGEVAEGSAADKAGLEEGDIITALDGRTVESASDLRNLLRDYSAGDTAEMTYYRAGESKSVTIVFDERTPDIAAQVPEKEP
jgi:serine protease Do